jgi:hypothetical protein
MKVLQQRLQENPRHWPRLFKAELSPRTFVSTPFDPPATREGARNGKRPRLEGGGMLVTATLRGAVIGLARDSGRLALAASMPGRRGVPATATPRGAVSGLVSRQWEARIGKCLRLDACLGGGGDASRRHTSRSHR